MALITDLPASTTLASTDVLLKDTGSVSQKITATNAANSLFGLATQPLAIEKGGTGQTGQTGQTTWTPTISIADSEVTVTNLSASYKRWGMTLLMGGRFALSAAYSGALVISYPPDTSIPNAGTQVAGILIDPNHEVYHIRLTATGMRALSNGGAAIALSAGMYCFWAIGFSI